MCDEAGGSLKSGGAFFLLTRLWLRRRVKVAGWLAWVDFNRSTAASSGDTVERSG